MIDKRKNYGLFSLSAASLLVVGVTLFASSCSGSSMRPGRALPTTSVRVTLDGHADGQRYGSQSGILIDDTHTTPVYFVGQAGDRLELVVSSPGDLIPKIEIYGPHGNELGCSESGPEIEGRNYIFRGCQLPDLGTYQIAISSRWGDDGDACSVQVTLWPGSVGSEP